MQSTASHVSEQASHVDATFETRQSTPFPQLAAAIRDAPVLEVIETFKELAELAIEIQRKERLLMWRMHLSLNHHGPGQVPLHPLSKLMSEPDKVFQFVHDHLKQIVHPPNIVVHISRNTTRAEEWIVRCAIHPDVDTDSTLSRLWSRYLEKQPQYNPGISTPPTHYVLQVREAMGKDPMLTNKCFPGLRKALHPFASGDTCDLDGIFAVLREYMCLGATVAGFWAHMWQSHRVPRGSHVPAEDGHIYDAMILLENHYSQRFGN